MKTPKHALLILLLSLLVVDGSLAQKRPMIPRRKPIRSIELPRPWRSLLEKEIHGYVEPIIIGGKVVNQKEIDKYNETVVATRTRKREFQRVLSEINPQLINSVLREKKFTTLVVEANYNNAVHRFLYIVIQESEGLSGNREAVLLIDSVVELVYAASHVENPLRAEDSIGRSSLAYHVIEVVSDALEGLAKDTVDKKRAEQLVMSLKLISNDIAVSDNVHGSVKEVMERRFVEEEKDSVGDQCYDQANRLVLTKDADGEVRWLCLWEKVTE